MARDAVFAASWLVMCSCETPDINVDADRSRQLPEWAGQGPLPKREGTKVVAPVLLYDLALTALIRRPPLSYTLEGKTADVREYRILELIRVLRSTACRQLGVA